MKSQASRCAKDCPVTVSSIRRTAQTVFAELLDFCETCDKPFWQYEKKLRIRMAALGVCLIRLFLTARHERLEVSPFLEDGNYRPGESMPSGL